MHFSRSVSIDIKEPRESFDNRYIRFVYIIFIRAPSLYYRKLAYILTIIDFNLFIKIGFSKISVYFKFYKYK